MTYIHRRSTRPGVTQTPGSRYRGASGSEPLAPIREIGYRRGGTIGGEGERLRIGTVNVGTMRGREGEVVEMMERRCVDNVIGVERVSERVMVVKVTVGKVILCVVSVYGPQMGRLMEEKEGFYVELGGVVDGFGEQEVVMVCGDLNGHVGEDAGGGDGAGVCGGERTDCGKYVV